MTCKVLTPDMIDVYENTHSVSLPGFKGMFQVMSRHAELFELLKKGTIHIVGNDGSRKKFTIEEGACRFAKDTLTVITEQTSPAEEDKEEDDDENEEFDE